MLHHRLMAHSIRIGSGAIITIALTLSLLQHFVLTLPERPLGLPSADGIVVATGGQARLQAGIDLLKDGAASQLLLTGVGNGITKDMIASSLNLSQADRVAFECCVSLESTAQDTIGNAIAAKVWAKGSAIQKIVLVTSDYHMPRAALEFANQMPERAIIAYPISAPDLAGKSWYSDWPSFRLYMREFLKYRWRSARLSL